MKRFLLWLGSALFFALVLLAAGVLYVVYWFSSPGPLSSDVTVLIEPGTGFNRISEQLHAAGVMEDTVFFRGMVVLYGNQAKFKAGEYRFEAGITPEQVMHTLVAGETVIHAITIAEGLTSRQVLEKILSDDRLSGDIPTELAEGSLLPETFHFHRGQTRRDLLERLQRDQQQLLDALWQNRQEGLPLKTKQEAVILASIVEKETGVDGERGRVAAVFVNRLRKGMLLQSDPTVIYGIELEKGPMNRLLRKKDLKVDHPYNTYLHAGLPSGPIANPGEAALEAVLNPPHSDEYYFVATGRGGHYFARTLKEHNDNVARYRAYLRQQR